MGTAKAFATDARNPLLPRIVGAAKGSAAQAMDPQLLVEGSDARGGVAEVDRFQDDDYTVLVDVTMNSGTYAEIWFRRLDPENGYIAYLGSDGTIRLDEMVNGFRRPLANPGMLMLRESMTPGQRYLHHRHECQRACGGQRDRPGSTCP